MALDQRVHRFTTEEYDRMVALGALPEARIEFLDGLLVDEMTQGEPHARVIQALTGLFAGRWRQLRVQMPLAVAEGWTPEPDVALVEESVGRDRHPTTALLVIEVAVCDQTTPRLKMPVYAAAGIPIYWIVDVPAARVLEYTDPERAGYAAVRVLEGADVLDAGIASTETMSVRQLLSW